MRLLLDTHVLLWWLGGRAISKAAGDAIADPDNEADVSAASAWEIAIKKAIGKLAAPDDLEDQIRDGGFTPLPIRIDHALVAGELPRHHDDPFDRMLAAQATVEGLVVVTRDRRFADYGVQVLPA